MTTKPYDSSFDCTADVPIVTITHKRHLAGAFFDLLVRHYTPGWLVEVLLWCLSSLVNFLAQREKATLNNED